MKTQKEVQHIFEKLVQSLHQAVKFNLDYATRDNIATETHSETPLAQYLAFAQNTLKDENLSEEFFEQAYRQALHIGTGPTDRNHLQMHCNRSHKSDPKEDMEVYIDLKALKTLINTHLNTDSHYSPYGLPISHSNTDKHGGRYEIKFNVRAIPSGGYSQTDKQGMFEKIKTELHVKPTPSLSQKQSMFTKKAGELLLGKEGKHSRTVRGGRNF